MPRIVCAASLLLVMTWLCGCTPRNDPAPATTTVKGTVKLDGKPMADGSISFEVTGQPPQEFEIKAGSYSGDAFVGANKVHVTKMKEGPPSTTDPTTKTTINTVADKFSGPNTTLKAEVMKSGANDFNFDVTSAPAAK